MGKVLNVPYNLLPGYGLLGFTSWLRAGNLLSKVGRFASC